jgi:hypothetical protein
MTTGSPRAGRLPRDVRARARLRVAQSQEADAVAAVCTAQDTLRKARAKREAVLATASVAVDQAQASLETAQGALVGVCGLERAAVLLGIDASKLGKCVGTRRARAVES